MTINIAILEKALANLERNHAFKINEKDVEKQFAFETATIKSFEYNYELALKLIKRTLEDKIDGQEVESLSFNGFIRTAAEKNLISDPTLWFDYRKKRNTTAHTYDEEKADEIFYMIPNFIKEIKFVITQIKKQNAS